LTATGPCAIIRGGFLQPLANGHTSVTTSLNYDAGNVTSDSRSRYRALLYDADNSQRQSSSLDGTSPVW
jgi:hypothetical protein